MVPQKAGQMVPQKADPKAIKKAGRMVPQKAG